MVHAFMDDASSNRTMATSGVTLHVSGACQATHPLVLEASESLAYSGGAPQSVEPQSSHVKDQVSLETYHFTPPWNRGAGNLRIQKSVFSITLLMTSLITIAI